MLISDPLPLTAKQETKLGSECESSAEECSESESEGSVASATSAASGKSSGDPNVHKEKLAACSLCVDVG